MSNDMEKLTDLASVDVDARLYDPDQVRVQVITLWRKSMEGILTICRLLYLTQRRWGSKSRIWKGILRDLPFHRSTINKLIAIGRDRRLFDPKITRSLPPNWGTLHEITKLDDRSLYEFVGAGEITPESSRADIIFLRSSGVDGSSDPYRIQSAWIDEYLDYLSRVGEQEKIRKSISFEASGGRKLRDVVEYSPSEIEKHIRNITDPLYVVRVRRGCDISVVDAALAKMTELVAIEGVLPISVNRKTLRNAHQRTIDRLLNLCGLFYGMLLGEESWRVSASVDARGIYLKGLDIGDEILRFLNQDRIVSLLDYYSVEHPLFEVLSFYLDQIGGRVDPASRADDSGSVRLVLGQSDKDDFRWMVLREHLFIRLGSIAEGFQFDLPKPAHVFQWEGAGGHGWNPYPLERVREQEDAFIKARGVVRGPSQSLEEFMMDDTFGVDSLGSYDDEVDLDFFETGDVVEHDKFGRGRVVDFRGEGSVVEFFDEEYRDPKYVRSSRLRKAFFSDGLSGQSVDDAGDAEEDSRG